MAEENKTQQEVELDTDSVKEEPIISVDPPSEPDESFSQKENVDLGYTDPIRETKVDEEPEEKKEEPKTEVEVGEKKEVDTKTANLKDKQTSYQKRINELVFQAKEAERREKAALNYAKGLKNKYQNIETKLNETDTNYLKEIQARVSSEQDKLKGKLKDALEAQDADKVAEINTLITKLAVDNEKASMLLGEKEAQKKQNEENKKSSQEELIPGEAPVKISQKAQSWASENKWFGTDEVMTGAAMAIDSQLRAQGIETDSDEYYNNVNKRMREYFPQKFAQDTADKETEVTKQPVQNVASVSRRQGGRKSVKLTKSQVVIAKKLGVPLEEYAKFVKGGN